MERSQASSCPSLAYQLVGTKKMQQVLARKGMVERYMFVGVISYYERAPGLGILFSSRIEVSDNAKLHISLNFHMLVCVLVLYSGKSLHGAKFYAFCR